MFIDILKEKNPKLIQTALSLHTNGTIMPDSYIIDVDIFKENAELIKAESDKHNINLYYMTKQNRKKSLSCENSGRFRIFGRCSRRLQRNRSIDEKQSETWKYRTPCTDSL